MVIDHVLLATQDVDAAADRLRAEHGLVSVPGGSHSQWGTVNRIVPLGGAYLEIIGIRDPVVAASSPFGRWIKTAARDGDALAGFMVQPDDFDGVCTRLSLTPTNGQRERPDGTVLSWRLAGMAEAMSDRRLPCFIDWANRDATFLGDAGVGATGISRLELGGDPHQITAWLGGQIDQLVLVGGEPGIRSMSIASAARDLVIPGDLSSGRRD